MQQSDEGQETGPSVPWLFPREYSFAAEKWLHNVVNELQKELHPFLGSIGRMPASDMPQPQNEGSPPTSDLASPLYRSASVEHIWITSPDELLAFDIDSFLTNVAIAADQIGGKIVKDMIDHLSAVCDQTGNTVSAAGKDFYDAFIEAIESAELAFDEEGNLEHSILLHPDTYEKITKNPPSAEQEEKIKLVIDRKRDEWNAARCRRDLPEITD